MNAADRSATRMWRRRQAARERLRARRLPRFEIDSYPCFSPLRFLIEHSKLPPKCLATQACGRGLLPADQKESSGARQTCAGTGACEDREPAGPGFLEGGALAA